MSKWHDGCWRQPHPQADLLVYGSDDLPLVSDLPSQVSVCIDASYPLFWSISSLLWIVLLCQKVCNEYLVCPLRPTSASSLLLDSEDQSVHDRLSFISTFLVVKVSERWRNIWNKSQLGESWPTSLYWYSVSSSELMTAANTPQIWGEVQPGWQKK